MNFEAICKIAEHVNLRMAISYAGNDNFTVGLSDGVTTPIMVTGSSSMIEETLNKQLMTYNEVIKKEALIREAQEAEQKKRALEQAALAEMKRMEVEKRNHDKKIIEDNQKNQLEFALS